MHNPLTWLLTTLLLALPLTRLSAAEPAPEDLVIVVNPASGVSALASADAVNIFMGRYRRLPSGLVAFPIDISGGDQRQRFYWQLVRKNLAEIDAYWARLVFSGQTSPPLQVPDDATAVALVAQNRAAIAYVARSRVDARVRIVMALTQETP